MDSKKVIPIDSSVKWQGKNAVTEVDGVEWTNVGKAPERRYSIQSDGDHKYFVEVGMEAEFEAFCDSFYEHTGYEGHNYEKNRIDGLFTFTDPRNE